MSGTRSIPTTDARAFFHIRHSCEECATRRAPHH
jgi:hypothetical protein